MARRDAAYRTRQVGTILEEQFGMLSIAGSEKRVAGNTSLAPGAILQNTYRIVRSFAQGGMGELYVAEHLRLGRTLVIKVLHAEYAADEESAGRFKREAQLLAQLHHPNIVQVLDFNASDEGERYLALELIEGPDLKAALDAGRRFAPAEIMAIVRQIASALQAAHDADIVHRDLKLDNVVLCPAAGQLPVVKVIDFGIASQATSEHHTAERCLFGTPEYMAPEQARGLREQVDARTDQYSLAVLTYVLFGNHLPFRGDTALATLYNIVHEEPTALGPAAGWNNFDVQCVLRKGMARAREDRYPSVLAFADALEVALIDGGALSAPAALTNCISERSRVIHRSSTTLRTRRRRRPRLQTLVAVAAIVFGLGSLPRERRASVRHRVVQVQQSFAWNVNRMSLSVRKLAMPSTADTNLEAQ